MMQSMQAGLQHLVHFFHDERYRFKTITMAAASETDDICDAIASRRGWFWVRYSPRERDGYMQRRRFVERAMYDDYTHAFGGLTGTVPVYCYLIPDLTEVQAIELAQRRTRFGETEPHVVMVKVEDIDDTRNMTFTLHDSHTSYRARMTDAGLAFGGDSDAPDALPDHGKIFPFSMIEQIHAVYGARPISYEVQFWDHAVLERVRHIRPMRGT